MILTEKTPRVLDDPESHVSIVDFTAEFPSVLKRARQSRDVTPLYVERLPRLYSLRTGGYSTVDELSDVAWFVKSGPYGIAVHRWDVDRDGAPARSGNRPGRMVSCHASRVTVIAGGHRRSDSFRHCQT
jgi:hypothetical protein